MNHIIVRSKGKLYRFPDDTPQDVMKGAIDKHIMSFQSLKGTSAITGKPLEQPPISHEAGQEGYIPKAIQSVKDIAKKVPAIKTASESESLSEFGQKWSEETKANLKNRIEIMTKDWSKMTPEDREYALNEALNAVTPFGMIGGKSLRFYKKLAESGKYPQLKKSIELMEKQGLKADDIAMTKLPPPIKESSQINAITRGEAGKMIAEGNETVLEHIKDGLNRGITKMEMQDAIRNQIQKEIVEVPKEMRAKIRANIQKLEPKINKILKGGD